MDPRDRARRDGRWYKSVDERSMKVVVEVFNDDDAEVTLELPFEYVTCPLCDGKGRHVNPSIDAHGISGDEFREDPDFAEEYMSGMYDVECYECAGKRVVPEVQRKRLSDDDRKLFTRYMSGRAEESRERDREERYAY